MQAFITNEQFDQFIGELQKRLPDFKKVGQETFTYQQDYDSVGSLWVTPVEQNMMKMVLFGAQIIECLTYIQESFKTDMNGTEYKTVLPKEIKMIPAPKAKYSLEIPGTEVL